MSVFALGLKYLSLPQALFLGIGLQHKSLDQLEKELELPSSQLMGLFNRIIRKVVQVGAAGQALDMWDHNSNINRKYSTKRELDQSWASLTHPQLLTINFLQGGENPSWKMCPFQPKPLHDSVW